MVSAAPAGPARASTNSTWPPPQVMRVGLELNQHGQAALQEQASSSWPVIFHGTFAAAAASLAALVLHHLRLAFMAGNHIRFTALDFV